MTPAGFEPKSPQASGRRPTPEMAVTGIGCGTLYIYIFFFLLALQPIVGLYFAAL